MYLYKKINNKIIVIIKKKKKIVKIILKLKGQDIPEKKLIN